MTGSGHGGPDPDAALRSQLAQAERDEEWALWVLLGWLALLLFIVFVLLFSPVPWGAVIGLVVWALGFGGVWRDFSAAVGRTRTLRGRLETREQGGAADD